MPSAETMVPIIVEIICGAAGGVFLGWLFRRFSLGTFLNVVVGAAGGLLLTWLAGRVPGLGRFVGRVEQAADAAAQSMGGLSPGILVGVGVAGLLGGLLLTLLAGLARNRLRAGRGQRSRTT